MHQTLINLHLVGERQYEDDLYPKRNIIFVIQVTFVEFEKNINYYSRIWLFSVVAWLVRCVSRFEGSCMPSDVLLYSRYGITHCEHVGVSVDIFLNIRELILAHNTQRIRD